MAVDTAEVWAPGARAVISLAALTGPEGLDGRVALAVGATAELVEAAAELDADGLLRLRLATAEAGTIRLVARFAVVDPVALWHPGSGEGRGTLPPSWVQARTTRALADIPIGCLVGRQDTALVGFGVAGGGRPVQVRAGMIEESGEFLLELHIAQSRQAEIVLDLRGADFADSVRSVARAIGLRREPASVRDEQPVLCTWYSFHQDLVVDELLADARIAGELGIGTVIIDDGWQTADAARGYGSCGDWAVERGKIPDPRGLVRELDGLGLRTLWWIGTPFIGYRSQTFQDGLIPLAYEEAGLDAAVLDPRSPAARRVVVERLQALLADTGAHGFKLDFLERFAQDGGPPPDDADRDSIEDGGLLLLDEIGALGVAEPLMIEFREPYITGPALSRGTMFRIADCPLSPLQNRRGIVDLRLLGTEMAVHGDPIMWTPADTPERVAQQLIASLFGVPQLSVRLAELSAPHRETVAHWLGFWQRHSDLLLHAPLQVAGVERDYAIVEASAGGIALTVRYGDGLVVLPSGGGDEWHVVNGGEAGVVVIGLDGWPDSHYEIRDARGRIVAEGSRAFGTVELLAVPAGGRFSAWR
ncbi:alpha-galactosidase [Microbacterium sp. P5_E9]